jgi:Uma2 family endonuclease
LLSSGSQRRLLSQPGIVPRVRANRNFRIPDLAVTCAPPALGLMVPDPILLIEMLSPGNEAQTRANIWAYTTIPTVREIVAVHSTRIEAEFLCRGADQSWPEEPVILTGSDTLNYRALVSPSNLPRSTGAPGSRQSGLDRQHGWGIAG